MKTIEKEIRLCTVLIFLSGSFEDMGVQVEIRKNAHIFNSTTLKKKNNTVHNLISFSNVFKYKNDFFLTYVVKLFKY